MRVRELEGTEEVAIKLSLCVCVCVCVWCLHCILRISFWVVCKRIIVVNEKIDVVY